VVIESSPSEKEQIEFLAQKSNQEVEAEVEVPKDERMLKAGTAEQTEVINDYPTHHTEDKLKVPYIERYNGNICVKNQNFEGAISHYNKALLSLKMLFQGNEGTGDMYVTDRDQAVKMLIDIETPAYLNLAH
jgi:hypothetical protein